MCRGICRTGFRCKREHFLDSVGLCRDHKDQYYTLRRQDELQRQRREKYFKERKEQNHILFSKKQFTNTSCMVDLSYIISNSSLSERIQRADQDFQEFVKSRWGNSVPTLIERIEKVDEKLENATKMLVAMKADLLDFQQLVKEAEELI